MKVSWISIAAVDAGMSSAADEVIMMNFPFHSGSDRRSELNSFNTSLSMTLSMIDGVTEAVVADLAT
jgi:hypothetical protein